MMKYYTFRRRKDHGTITYAVITENKISILPDDVWDGRKYIKGDPWEAVGIIDEENKPPGWFRQSDADENIKSFGFWQVDMAEAVKYFDR
jgi:hypothetical protein